MRTRLKVADKLVANPAGSLKLKDNINVSPYFSPGGLAFKTDRGDRRKF